MNIKNINTRIQYEEYFKIFKERFPRLNKKSVPVRLIRTMIEYGPSTWKEIQSYVWKYYANTNSPINSSSYGIDMRWKCEFMMNRLKDPSDKRKVLYEVNEIGKVFMYYVYESGLVK